MSVWIWYIWVECVFNLTFKSFVDFSFLLKLCKVVQDLFILRKRLIYITFPRLQKRQTQNNVRLLNASNTLSQCSFISKTKSQFTYIPKPSIFMQCFRRNSELRSKLKSAYPWYSRFAQNQSYKLPVLSQVFLKLKGNQLRSLVRRSKLVKTGLLKNLNKFGRTVRY